MMLDTLIHMNGVVAAGELSADGKLLRYKTKMGMPQEMKKMSAEFCSTITMMFNTMSDALTQVSHMKLLPQHAWAYSGGDWVVVVGGNYAVYAEMDKADVSTLFRTLSGSVAGTPAPEAHDLHALHTA